MIDVSYIFGCASTGDNTCAASFLLKIFKKIPGIFLPGYIVSSSDFVLHFVLHRVICWYKILYIRITAKLKKRFIYCICYMCV